MDPFGQTLHRAGYSITAARRRVFKALQSTEPLTMRQIISRCRSVDRASVYRTIGLFEELGIIERLQSGWKYRIELSDSFNRHHHHATCLICGRALDIPADTRLEIRLYEIAELLNFQLERHQLELQGICADCQKKRPF